MEQKPQEVLFKALKGQETERPAWVPFVGVHGGYLIDIPAREYLLSSERIVSGIQKAIEYYQPDGIPLMFDLQIEAEILGCGLQWYDDVPPAVSSHPLIGEKTIEDLPEFRYEKGRLPLLKKVAEKIIPQYGEQIAFYGLVTGPFTLSAHLRGSDLFTDMLIDDKKAHTLMRYSTTIARKMADFYLDLGCSLIALVDPMTSQISPQHFSEFVKDYLDDVFRSIRNRGGYTSLFVCGDATKNLDIMCQTNCHQVSIDENIPLDLACKVARSYGKSVGGNLKLTTVLLLGKPADAMLDAIRCIDSGGTQGFVLSPGCDLPYHTPPANLEAVAEMVHNAYKRQVARMTLKPSVEDTYEDIPLPDYPSLPYVLVECITLDSTACAPCLFTVDTAIKVKELCSVPVEVREHKIKSREGLGYMKHLKINSIPTICIDGIPAFQSALPDPPTLAKAIEEHAKKMGKK